MTAAKFGRYDEQSGQTRDSSPNAANVKRGFTSADPQTTAAVANAASEPEVEVSDVTMGYLRQIARLCNCTVRAALEDAIRFHVESLQMTADAVRYGDDDA